MAQPTPDQVATYLSRLAATRDLETMLASYAFMLEQDLADVPLEFVVPDRFVKSMVRLQELQERIGVRFPDVVLNADQFDTDEGVEVALRAGVRRRSREAGSATEGIVV